MAADRFDVFISYARAPSTALASQLQTSLERFAKPWNKVRAMRVFRDDQSMAANSALWSTIERGLIESSHLILLVTPEAAASEYVGKEIQWWVANKQADTVLLVHQDGPLDWDDAAGDFTADSAVPPPLRGAFAEEPRWVELSEFDTDAVDADDPRFTNAVADLSAAVRGVDRDALVGENVAQHRKTMRMARAAIVGLSVLLVASLAAGVLAFVQRNSAARQARMSLAQRLAVEGSTATETDTLVAVQKIAIASTLDPDATLRVRNNLLLNQLPGVTAVGVASAYVTVLGDIVVKSVRKTGQRGFDSQLTDTRSGRIWTVADAVVDVRREINRMLVSRPTSKMLAVVDMEGSPVGREMGPFVKVEAAIFSASGSRMYVKEEGINKFQVWDLETGMRRWSYAVPIGSRAVPVPDDRLLVSSCESDGSRKRCRMSLYSDGPDARVEVGPGSVTAVSSQAIAVVEEKVDSFSYTYSVWDVLRRRRIGRLDLPPDVTPLSLPTFRFSDDGGVLLVASRLGATVFGINQGSGEVLVGKQIQDEPVASEHLLAPAIAAINDGGTLAALATEDGIRVFPINLDGLNGLSVADQKRYRYRNTPPPNGPRAHQDLRDQVVKQSNILNQMHLRGTGRDSSLLPARGMRLVAFTTSGAILLSTDSAVLLAQPLTWQEACNRIDDEQSGLSVCSSKSSKDVVTVRLAKYSGGSFKPEFERTLPTGAQYKVLALDPNRRRVVLSDGFVDGGDSAKVQIWDLKDQKSSSPTFEFTIQKPRDSSWCAVGDATFSPSGRYVAVRHCRGDVQFWDLDQQRMVSEYRSPVDRDWDDILAVALDERGEELTLVVVTKHSRIVVNGRTGELVAAQAFDEEQRYAVITRDRFATVGSETGRVRVFSGPFATGDARQETEFIVPRSASIALTADGSTVAVMTTDSTVRGWRRADVQEVFTIRVATTPQSRSSGSIQFLDRGAVVDVLGRTFRIKATRDDVCRLLDANVSRATWDRAVGKAYKYVKGCPNLPIEGE